MKQAAIRSLSCEVIPGKEGQIYFGDSTRGHVLSCTFFLKDAQARGFNRWYSLLIFMKDKHLLLNSWPFFEKYMHQIVNKLQNNAAQVYFYEQNKCSQRLLRITGVNRKYSPVRSLIKLTSNRVIFAELHLWFTWLLSTGGKRLEEQSPTKFLNINFKRKFVKMIRRKKEVDFFDQDKCIWHFRKLRKILGPYNFRKIIYSTLIGRQIIVRGPRIFVLLVTHLLQIILPPEKCRCVDFGEKYCGPDVCNILGLDLFAAVPKASETIFRLDIIPVQNLSKKNIHSLIDAYSHYDFVIKTESDLPQKLPSLLLKIDKALSDETLNHRVVLLHLTSLMEQWHHLSEVVREAKKKQYEINLADLMQLLGIFDHDEKLVEFWAS